MQQLDPIPGKLRRVTLVRRILRSRVVRTLLLVSAPLALARVAGCAATPASTQPASAFSDQQNAAMNDPFNYKPSFNGTDNTRTYDSGGMKKDLNDVLNP